MNISRSILLIILSWSGSLSACDFCNYYLGLNPNYNQNTIGARYRSSSFLMANNSSGHLRHNDSHSEGNKNESYEYYGTYTIWGRFYPTKELQISASLRYSDNFEMESDLKTEQIRGVGDFILRAQYQIFNTPPDSNKTLRQRLFLGGGVKLPTGMYNVKSTNGSLSPFLQAGTGSIDLIASLNYMAKIKKFGLGADITYRYTTANSNGFRFANRLNTNTLLFYQIKYKSLTIMPSSGVYMEQALQDQDNGSFNSNTGGLTLFSQSGLDIYFKKIALNLGYQIPFYENLNGIQGENKSRLIVGLNYAFN